MTSNRPYLVRAMYEWINDNGMTPHLVVDSAHPDLRVPRQAVRDGKVVLNIAPRAVAGFDVGEAYVSRSEEHTSELQSLMRISYAVFCLKTKKTYRTKQY